LSIEAIAWAFNQDVTPAAKKLVLIALCDNADQHGICFPSFTHIEKKTSLSRRAVISHIQALEEEGLLCKAPRFRKNASHSTNAYKLPISNEDLGDHPLISFFEGGSANPAPPPSANPAPPPSANPALGSANPAPPITINKPLKEKKALTRSDFLREIDGAFQGGEFSAFEHLTESEIKSAAEAVWDHWAAKGEWPGGSPVAILRNWIRGGIAQGRIRKRDKYPPMEMDDRPKLSAEDSQWRMRLKSYVDSGFWMTMFGPAPDESGCKAPAHLMKEFFPDGRIPANA
jgi:hypothetical protein